MDIGVRECESVATCTAGIRARKASRSNISPLENKVHARIPPGHDLQHVTVGVEFKTVRQLGIPVEMRFLGPLPAVHGDGAQVCGRMTPKCSSLVLCGWRNILESCAAMSLVWMTVHPVTVWIAEHP